MMMIESKVIFGKYEMQRLLGKGTFGSVYYAKSIQTDESVAIKVMKKVDIEEAGMIDQITREISVMAKVKHTNIVELKEVMATRTKIYLVMEYLQGGELCNKVRRAKLSDKDARRYFQQLISAVEFCHSRGIYHRDLKLENLLLDGTEENVKVADFGLSASTEQFRGDGLLHTVCGAPAYMAPEVILRRGYDGVKADIWSCGVILFALLSGTLPFQDESLQRMYDKIVRADYEFRPGFPHGARKLVGKMLVVDPKRRISIEALKRDPWFLRGINRSISTAVLSEMGGSNNGRFLNTLPTTPTTTLARSTMMPGFFNAFELISSMASGFNLSSLFGEQSTATSMFTSRRPAEEVVAEIERMAREMRFEVERVKEFKLKLAATDVGEEGRRLEVSVEVFRSAPELTVVELSQTGGEAAEFVRFCEEKARPGLGDIIWTWRGDCEHTSLS
ncbi:hypothetical protein V2J09_003299 [Rumex salicifolius]